MVFDSNELIHAVYQNSELRGPCLQRLEQDSVSDPPTFLTWSICYEFLRVSTHQNVLPSPLTPDRALRFLNELLDSPGFVCYGPQTGTTKFWRKHWRSCRKSVAT